MYLNTNKRVLSKTQQLVRKCARQTNIIQQQLANLPPSGRVQRRVYREGEQGEKAQNRTRHRRILAFVGGGGVIAAA